MSWRATQILLSAALVLFAFVWLVERPMREKRLQDANHVILQGFDPATVNTIEVRPRDADEIVAERQPGPGNTWRLTRPISYAARTGPIQALLDALAKVTWQDRVTSSELKNVPDAQEKFGFADAPMEIAAHGARSAKILIGQTSAFGDEVFLEVVGEPDIYRVSTNFLAVIPADKDQWRDRALLDLTNLPYQTIAVRAPVKGIEFELERDPTNHLWFMSKPVRARADNGGVNALLDSLQDLPVTQFVTDDPKAELDLYGLQTSAQTPELDLSFRRGSNVLAELAVGMSPTNQPGLAFARRLDPSNIVVIARDRLQAWEGSYTNFLDYHFISVSPGTIGAIEVQGADSFAVRAGNGGEWTVSHGQEKFPADAILMRDWLASFTNVQTQIEATVANDFKPYGLDHPVLQYRVEKAAAGMPLIAEIDFGATTNGKIFERRPDERSINSVKSADFDRLPRAAWALRDRRLWTFDTSNVVSLTVRQQKVTRRYLRDPTGDWTFAPGYHGPPIPNWPAIEEGVHRLGELRAVYWSGVGEAALKEFGFADTNLSLSLELKRGGKMETVEVRFGGRSPYSYPYATVLKDGQQLVFEFPVDLYENFIEPYMAIPLSLRNPP
jgi:hypothetical protein